MGIFRRGNRGNKVTEQATAGEADEATADRMGTERPDEDPSAVAESAVAEHAVADGELTSDVADDGGTDDPDPAPAAAGSEPVSRADGPFDRSEVPGPDGRLELGSLWVRGLPGVDLRLEIDQETQSMIAVTAMLGESTVQLQAFAAPRSEGIWDDIRAEIGASITGQGGSVEEVRGPLGPELQTRMPGRGPDGRTAFSPTRFLGVDGPRWFLRAVLSGPAAVDPDAAQPLLDLVCDTVVVRGEEAMAPRELLALALPDDVVAAPPDGAAQDEPEDGRSAEDLNPFERGPEITEIR